VQLLVASDADPDFTTNTGRTPRDAAREAGLEIPWRPC
jgi:hypothetical protein